MKKTLATIGACIMVSGALVSCSGGGDDAAGGNMEAINLWMPTLANDNRDKEMWQDISAAFTKDTGVNVNITIVPWDAYETKFLTGVASGNGPDVGYMYPEMLGDYIKKNQLVDLDKYITEKQKDNLLYLDKGKYQGKQYGLPLLVGAARVLFYNKDLLEKAGVTPPTTWEDFASGGMKLKEAGITPWVAPWGDKGRGIMNSNFFPFIWQNDGRLFSEDGSKTEFNTPAVVEAATYLKDLKDKGVLAESSTGANVESTRKSFQSGESAYIVESEAKAPLWEKAGVNYGYVLSLKHKSEASFFASDQLVMFKACKNKETCFKFMDYLTQASQMERFHKQAPYQPVGKDEPAATQNQFSEIYAEHRDVLRSLPIVPNSLGAYNALYANMQAMLTGAKTPEQALEDAAKQGDAALAK